MTAMFCELFDSLRSFLETRRPVTRFRGSCWC